jgi:hypothetical protein
MFSPVGAPRLWVERSTDAPVGALEVAARPPAFTLGCACLKAERIACILQTR